MSAGCTKCVDARVFYEEVGSGFEGWTWAMLSGLGKSTTRQISTLVRKRSAAEHLAPHSPAQRASQLPCPTPMHARVPKRQSSHGLLPCAFPHDLLLSS